MTTKPTIYGGDSVRVSLVELKHDQIDGGVKTAADVSYTVYRASGSTAATGDLAYTTRFEWSALVTLPEIDADETMRVVLIADIQDSSKAFEISVPVKAAP